MAVGHRERSTFIRVQLPAPWCSTSVRPCRYALDRGVRGGPRWVSVRVHQTSRVGFQTRNTRGGLTHPEHAHRPCGKTCVASAVRGDSEDETQELPLLVHGPHVPGEAGRQGDARLPAMRQTRARGDEAPARQHRQAVGVAAQSPGTAVTTTPDWASEGGSALWSIDRNAAERRRARRMTSVCPRADAGVFAWCCLDPDNQARMP